MSSRGLKPSAKRSSVASGKRSLRQSVARAVKASLPSANCSVTSSRRSRQRRALVCARSLALRGGRGCQLRKLSNSASKLGGAARFLPEASISPTSGTTAQGFLRPTCRGTSCGVRHAWLRVAALSR